MIVVVLAIAATLVACAIDQALHHLQTTDKERGTSWTA